MIEQNRGTRFGRRLVACGILLVGLTGCQSTLDQLFPAAARSASFAEAETRREQWRSEHRAEDIRWLLNNSVKNGMSRAEVSRLLGEDGDRVFDDAEILKQDSAYRSDDVVYGWGPDQDGNSYMLVFRDNHLVNFQNFESDTPPLP